jgi:hypothetical protein
VNILENTPGSKGKSKGKLESNLTQNKMEIPCVRICRMLVKQNVREKNSSYDCF